MLILWTPQDQCLDAGLFCCFTAIIMNLPSNFHFFLQAAPVPFSHSVIYNPNHLPFINHDTSAVNLAAQIFNQNPSISPMGNPMIFFNKLPVLPMNLLHDPLFLKACEIPPLSRAQSQSVPGHLSPRIFFGVREHNFPPFFFCVMSKEIVPRWAIWTLFSWRLSYTVSKLCFVANETGLLPATAFRCLSRLEKGLKFAATNGSNPYATRISRFVAIIPSGHTYAVASIRAGDDVKTISTNLGHATVAFTLDKYAHYTESMRQDSARRMEAFMAGINNIWFVHDSCKVKNTNHQLKNKALWAFVRKMQKMYGVKKVKRKCHQKRL